MKPKQPGKRRDEIDPLDITGRTYAQFARLLDMLEDPDRADEVTLPQLLGALKLLLQYDLSAIRKFRSDDEDAAGSAVHSFSKVFERNAARGEPAKAALHVVAEDDDDDDAGPAA